MIKLAPASLFFRKLFSIITHHLPDLDPSSYANIVLPMSMPAWGEALSEAQIDLLIDYLKTFCRDVHWPQGELNFRRAQVTTGEYADGGLWW
jgi:mono/diheme cytochrome c family protein